MSYIPPGGVTPASAFVEQRHARTAPPVAILADAIDPRTGEYLSLTRGATIADGLVVQLLRTERGTGAAVLEFGHRLRELRHVTSESPELVESMVREALAPAIEAGVVRFDRVEAAVAPGDATQVNTGIRYVDLLAPRRSEARRFTFTE
jgi:hypothetical protein